MIEPKDLRKRFLSFLQTKWKWVNTDEFIWNIPKVRGVYILVGSDILKDIYDIMYIGSSTNLKSRICLNHPIIKKINTMNCIVYYLPVKNGFYDYEIKLISKLKPKFNKEHKCK